MPDFKVTFRGDLGNLAQFDAAVRNSVSQSAKAIEQANRRIASQVGTISGLFSPKVGKGLFVNNLKAEIDGVNRTFKQSGDVIRRVISDYTVDIDKAGKHYIKPLFDDQYVSSFKKTIGDLDAYEKALKRTGSTEKKILADRLKTFEKILPMEEKIASLQAQAKSATSNTEQVRSAGAARIAIYQNALNQIPAGRQNNAARNKATADLQAEIAAQNQLMSAAVATENAIQAEIGQTIRQIENAERASRGRATALRNRNPAYGQLAAAANAIPPIQKDLSSALRNSEDLRKNLLGAGLGAGQKYGTTGFQKALSDQEAAVTRYNQNLRTGVTTVQGQFIKTLKDGSNILSTFAVDLDKNGKVIGRWGGQLAGAGTFLRQTVRDFQKVVEWTIATTVVFGTLAAVVTQLKSINELNTLLARLSITAQTSAQDTGKLFTALGEVSIATATPLKEIIQVADDIALATREAGDSTEEWRAKIVDLTTAVGIFTNLTGVETVTATDQLSSTFKQLSIQPNEIVGILSKVTAVAGGQANAIADIVKALSSVSEAARAAGFSVDEQIASVQVLSQVTSKTADEIATSFKNLFGSISSVGSVKILKEFGIEVRDAAGGIRPFLDIYREVSVALEKGIIPQNRLPDILRGISGGPRRAPDAAALLSNIGRIDEVVGRAAGASNEALIANAKLLDTNKAKIIQLQNAIDIAIFEKLGQSVSELVGFFTEVGTVVANAFNGLDANLVNVLLKFGALALIAKTLIAGLRLLGLGNLFAGLKNSLTQVDGQLTSIAAKSNLINGSARGPGGRFITPPATGGPGRFAGSAGKLLVGGLVAGGTLAALGSGADTNSIGAMLQFGGAITAMIPGLQAVGIGAALAGTAIQLFAGNTDVAKKSSHDLSVEVYTLTQAIQANQEEANSFSKAQASSLATIRELQAKTKRTADEQLRLSSATETYVTSTLGLAAANKRVSDSFTEILGKMPELSDRYETFKNQTNLSADALKKLQVELAKDILRGQGQDILAGEFAGKISPAFRTGNTENAVPSVKVRGGQVNFGDLLTNPALVDKLVAGGPAAQGGLTAEVVKAINNSSNQAFIQSALAQLKGDPELAKAAGLSPERVDHLIKVLTVLGDNVASFNSNSIALTQQQATIQAKLAIGVFNQKQGTAATTANNLAQLLNQGVGTFKPAEGRNTGGGGISELIEAQKLIALLSEKADAGIALTNDELIKAAKNVLILSGNFGDLSTVSDEALNRGILQTLQAAGVEESILIQLTQQFGIELAKTADEADELVAALQKAKNSASQNFADRSLQLQIAKNNGDFEKNAAGLATLTAQNEQAYKSELKLIEAISSLNSTGYTELAANLEKITGLQYLATLTGDELAGKQQEIGVELIENAIKAGVNAEGIKKIQTQILLLIATLNAIPAQTQTVVRVTTVYDNIKFPNSDRNIDRRDGGPTSSDIKKQKDANKEIKKIIDDINKIIGKGSGSSLGKLPSALKPKSSGSSAAYNKPGLLDIPEEIINSGNYQQLLNKAIANAKSLQSKVPGETKANRKEIVELLNGTKVVLEKRGIGEEYLRRAMDELTDQIKKQNELLQKADIIRRIRVQAGDISALANVPVNSRSGVSVGGPQGPVNVTLNLNGTVLTPAQFSQFADLIAASLKRQLSA